MLDEGTVLQERYRIEKQIGQGGMGAVYVAKDERFRSVVAIKETLFVEETYRKAFDREARLLNSLRHPALPNVTDYFAEGKGQFLVMEYIAGEDLYETLIRTGKPFPLDDVLIWADQLLDALDYLHNQNTPVIHRDIKPQNLKLTPNKQIILLDFGLAKGHPTDVTNQTAAKSIFGYSPGYASLEQIQGTGTEPRSDLYSLAATLYHLMTGVPPTDALTRAMSVLNGNADPLQPAHFLREEIPASVSEILSRAMALNANQRPISAAEMKQMFANKENITISANDRLFNASASSEDIHSRQTKIIPGTNPAQHQLELKTKVLENKDSDKNLSKITKLASKETASKNNFKNKYAIAASVFGILLLFGLGIFALLNTTPDKQQDSFDSANQNQVTEKSGQKNPITDNSSINLNSAENTVQPVSELPEQTKEQKTDEAIKQPNKTGDQKSTPNVSSNTLVGQNEINDDEKEIFIGNIRVKGDRVETDEFIVDGDSIIYKKKTLNANRNTRPPRPLSPEQMKKLTPEQQRKLLKALELQKRVIVEPPTPPTNN